MSYRARPLVFPCVVYNREATARRVNSKAEFDALGPGWVNDHPGQWDPEARKAQGYDQAEEVDQSFALPGTGTTDIEEALADTVAEGGYPEPEPEPAGIINRITKRRAAYKAKRSAKMQAGE
jgi:hypothetical protein